MSTVRESAIAKRRRLNNGTPTPASDSDLSAASTVVKKTKAKKRVKEILTDAVVAVGDPASSQAYNEEHVEGLDDNSFEPLASANVVKFSGSREIEAIDQDAIKVRLSRYQKCYVHGVAKLWIRDGSVSACGATLTESAQTYTVFASVSDAPVAIQAESRAAEFQLESVSISDNGTPSPLHVPGKFGLGSKADATSFRVLGHGDEPGPAERPGVDSANAFDTDIATHKLGLAISNLATPKPHVLICGRRHSSTSAASIALVNRCLSEATTTSSVGQAGVAFLDLDYASPTFGCPGTVSVTYIKDFVLGPSYTHPLSPNSISRNRLVASHFIGSGEHSNVDMPEKSIIEQLMRSDKSLLKSPWVTRTGAWVATASSEDLSHLHKMTSPDLVLNIDSSKSSPYYDAAIALTQLNSARFAHIPYTRSGTESSVAEHRYALQSHFRLHGYVDGVPLWYTSSIPSIGTRQLVLPIDDRENGLSFVSVRGGVLRLEDITEALQEALVTLVTVKSAQDSPRPSAAPFGLRHIDYSKVVQHLGLACVEHIDEFSKTIYLSTPVSASQIQASLKDGLDVGLVLEKPGPSGRFSRHLLFEKS
ncbi:Polynucleotide 5'-hydroxyl-kinase nol9 [Knufia fluminis]|uniref:Polynucleotide 5'-hydroxyl-kinase GRC3 n=1 Tax=Knufia fluminis TaxID=191047 RepID=A0AAN8FFZ0_9EURO|nr:Polynucleotide 5'-hydroxyl-kinase nol9 [Knufia fluminis]